MKKSFKQLKEKIDEIKTRESVRAFREYFVNRQALRIKYFFTPPGLRPYPTSSLYKVPRPVLKISDKNNE